jgi:hypothetical protein
VQRPRRARRLSIVARANETRGRPPPVLYLDQNAWIALARGTWDKSAHPVEHHALATLIACIKEHGLIVPLSFANMYETVKVNIPERRLNLARLQAVLSQGRVFRGRRRILADTLREYLAAHFDLARTRAADRWFLSDLWLEAAADYSPELYDFEVTDRVLDYIRDNPVETLLDYLAFTDDDVRAEAVRRYTAASADLVAAIERRRAIASGSSFSLRKRAYGARMIVDECDFILETGRGLGLPWGDVRDIGPKLVRKLVVDIPLFDVERELVVRLEDQKRPIHENDLRDLSAFTTALPFADVMIAEKPFVNLARQARLDVRYGTTMLTSVFEFAIGMLDRPG